MADFVLVHGAFAGGWAWGRIAPILRRAGHEVFTPTLSGLGDRAHVLTAEPITLSTHIEDVVRLLEFEDLDRVVLVGWSYGGGVVAGVADLVPERLSQVVNLDGEVAQEGLPLSAGWTDELRDLMADDLAEAAASGWLPAPTADGLADMIDDPEVRAWAGERERPQPFGTYTEPYPDTGGRRFTVPHTFVRCSADDEEEECVVTALRSDERWHFVEVPVNHLAVFHAPEMVAETLIGVLAAPT